MTIIQWLPQTLGQMNEWFKPITRKFVTVHTELQVHEGTKKVFYSALTVGVVIGVSLPIPAATTALGFTCTRDDGSAVQAVNGRLMPITVPTIKAL